MTKKKRTLMGAAIALIVLTAIAIGCVSLYHFHKTYVVIDGVEYPRSSTVLDISGRKIEKIDKLKELTGLEQLDLRDSGLTPEQFESLQKALPECEITWSVPFQGGFRSSDLVTLEVDTLSETDFAVFRYFPELEYIKADNCTDYDVLMTLIERCPDLKVTYRVNLGSKQVYNNARSVYIPDPDLDVIREGLNYLPDVTEIQFGGRLPRVEDLIAMKEDYPGIRFYWEFEILGVPADTSMEFLDLSGVQMEDPAELERHLPCFYNLTQVDMVKCGISNEEMVALNDRHPQIKFVWAVKVWGAWVRTDAKYFMPAKLHLSRSGSLDDLKYCTEMVVLDFGHCHPATVSFIEYMPNLQYLLLCEVQMRDLSVIGNCTSLVTLELFKSPITDFWPLTNLTNLRNLNLCKTPAQEEERVGAFGDATPLLQMTWLDRLWLTHTHIGNTTKNELMETLAHTEIVFYHENSSVKNGWRHSYDYYYHRDVMDMYYMT